MAVPYNPLNPSATPTFDIPGTGYTPDYKTLALTDPIYTTWKTGADAAIGRAGSKRQAALRALVLQYGGLPAGVSDQFGDLDPATMSQAGANPESTQHRLQAGYDAAQQQLQTGLAARGALHSGDLVQGLGQLNEGYQGNVADALTGFQGAFTGDLTGYGDDVTSAMSGQGDALAGATTAEMNNPANQPVAASVATLDPNWANTYGVPVYTGPDGSTYMVDYTTGVLTPWTPGAAYPGLGDPSNFGGPPPYVPPGGSFVAS